MAVVYKTIKFHEKLKNLHKQLQILHFTQYLQNVNASTYSINYDMNEMTLTKKAKNIYKVSGVPKTIVL